MMPKTGGVAETGVAAWLAAGAQPREYEPEVIGKAFTDVTLPSRVLQMEAERCIEAYFEDDSIDLASASDLLLALGLPGWHVTAIVHLKQLGLAHEAFRTCDVLLQAWWRDERGNVLFTSRERA